jgi:acyl-CoA thioesterase
MSNNRVHEELKRRSSNEPFAKLLGINVVDVKDGYALVRMQVTPELENVFGMTHGGALFSLIDEAFQLACNAYGTLAVALNVGITYTAAPEPGMLLEASARENHRTRKTASYLCEVRDAEEGKLIATAQALAYRTGKEFEIKE